MHSRKAGQETILHREVLSFRQFNYLFSREWAT